jgi:ferredoxin-type protein NapH
MKTIKTKTLRMTTMAVVAIIVMIGAIWHTGMGSLSAFGAGDISAICPLGYLEAALASRDIMPYMIISFLVIAGLTVLLGRAFCGWICPVPLVRKLLINKVDEEEQGAAAEEKSSSGLVILGVALGSSAICGFPVFCLICPIGLVFASLAALIRLLNFNEPTFDLIAFPLVIIIELVLLKKWCRKFCPVGALLSIFSRFNRNFVPTVDRSLCLEEKSGIKCQRCRSACNFDVALKNGSGTGDISDCTKCKECADNCPAHAIRFPWR